MLTSFNNVYNKIHELNEEFSNSVESLEKDNRELRQLLERSRYYIDIKITELRRARVGGIVQR
jgi:Skp family chaperone for outer membrane proteins